MSYTLNELSDWITKHSGIAVEVKGPADKVITKIATIDGANENEITFLANKKYKKHLETCEAGCVILSHSDSNAWQGNALLMENPYLGFALVAQRLDTTPQQLPLIDNAANVHPSAVIGKNVAIGPFVTVEADAQIEDNVQIGAGCFVGQGTIVGEGSRLWPNVTIYHGVTLGKNCTIHSSSVVGADGFGYAPQKIDGNQHWIKIPQLGAVIIGDNTEIGASTTIDRGAIEDTVIGKGVIVDNQVQLGHNVELGDYSAIASGTLIAGSTKIGTNVTIGGGVGIAGHLNICDNAFITGRTFVISDIMTAGVYSSGMPATTNKEWRNNAARYRKLTELFKRVQTLEKQLKD